MPVTQLISLGPFSDTRWHRSPTAREIALGCELYSSTPSPRPSLLNLPSTLNDCEISDDDDSVFDFEPVTPCTPAKSKYSAAYLRSPFWDKRWKRGLEEEDSDLEVYARDESPDRVNLLDVELEGTEDGRRHISAPAEQGYYDDVHRNVRTAMEEYWGREIGEESEDYEAWSGLRRNLWPKNSRHPHKRQENRRESEEELFWATERTVVSNVTAAHSAPSPSEIPAHPDNLTTPPSSHPANPASLAISSSPCIAAHLSSRLGHATMLEAALQLVEEHMMGGLSLFLHCPKRHVKEIWGADKIWDVRDKLDELDRQSPGFKRRIFVHSHETMNLASSYLRQPGSIKSGSTMYGQTMNSLKREMRTLELLGLRYLVVHPGSSSRCGSRGDDTRTQQIVASNIDLLLEEYPTITIVLESMACKNGMVVGTSLSALSLIRSFSAYPSRIRFCIDLCHIHSMFHDLSTADGRKVFFDDVESWLGYDNVICGHVSESCLPYGSGRGRHADFGSGYIGDQAFREILRHPSLSHVTWIIETPRYLPHDLTNQAVEALETRRQAFDIGHLRQISSMSDADWADTSTRGRITEKREYGIKRLRRAMMRAAGKEGVSKREIEDRARQSRIRRGRICRAVARSKEGNPGDEGSKRSPKREREAKLARERYKLRSISSGNRVAASDGAR